MNFTNGQQVTILPKATDKISGTWQETFRNLAKDDRGVAKGVWTTEGRYYPMSRVLGGAK